MIEEYADTTIGADYLKQQKVYHTDLLLEYLHGLIACKNDVPDNPIWLFKYQREIEAVKEILKIQTDGV